MRWLDAFFALRPLVLIPAWSFLLLGSATTSDGVPWWRLLHLTALLLATHLVNQTVDVETDRINDKGFFLQRGIFAPRHYVAAAVALLLTALVSAWIRHEAFGWLLAAGLLGLAYSVPPLRLSHRPGLDLVANAVGYGGLAFVLGRGSTNWTSEATWQVTACMLTVGSVFLHTTLLDLDGDRRSGKNTTGVVLGSGATRLLAALLATLGAVAVFPAHTAPLFGPCVVVAVLSWSASSRRVCVWGTTLFAVAATWLYWWFGAALVLLLLATRRYYRRRFGIVYPSF